MSLYDDIDIVEPVEKRPALSNESANASTSRINLNFLKTQLEAKKALLQNTHRAVSAPSPVVDLSSGQQKTKSLLNPKPRKALPLPIDSASTFTIVPKALKEDKVFLFGEITIEDEYDPATPTDYCLYKQKREAQKLKEKTAREVAERLKQEHIEEEAKRKVGAAIAPPKALIEQDSTSSSFSSSCSSSSSSSFANNGSAKPSIDVSTHFGKSISRGLGIAANIMSKMGYRQGAGLGRTQQGISSALRIEKVGKNSGFIRQEDERSENSGRNAKVYEDENDETLNPFSGFTGTSSSGGGGGGGEVSITEKLKCPSKIVILKNMVTPSEVDSELEAEVKDEMKKYGQVKNVIVHVTPNSSVDEAVRIFLEFSNVAQATKAIVDLNGRFFGGHAIDAAFYSADDYMEKRLEK